MGEINYFVCDACGVEDYWPRMPDGTPVEMGKGVACSAAWDSKFVNEPGKGWTVRMLHPLGRGDDQARSSGREGIWLCNRCRFVAEHAAGAAAIKALQDLGLPDRKDWAEAHPSTVRASEKQVYRVVEAEIARLGFCSEKALANHLPQLDERTIRHAVTWLVGAHKVKRHEVLLIEDES